ncbi:MAG: hypothetical protein UV38_C0001G0048 [candidate division TM6 bacterium GW2011_GWE2_42_60]|nr:MAG: hypothetical protein UV38_C0001G0048 [candidate division TM6 bacterium GW2011_GWE2_42_60]HBY05758.1 hypothetical protein [Candidatus Dependentiae bacterium]
MLRIKYGLALVFTLSLCPLLGMQEELIEEKKVEEKEMCTICIDALDKKEADSCCALACGHVFHTSCILSYLLVKCPHSAEFGGGIQEIDPSGAIFMCPLCRKEHGDWDSLFKQGDRWWGKRPLKERLDSLLVLPPHVFKQTLKKAFKKDETKKTVEEAFLNFTLEEQKRFLGRLSFDERIFYFRLLCEKNKLPCKNFDEVRLSMEILHDGVLLRPEDRLFLIKDNDEGRFSEFKTLESEVQGFILSFYSEKLSDKLFFDCFRELCSKKRSCMGDIYLVVALKKDWTRLGDQALLFAQCFAWDMANPKNKKFFLGCLWGLLGNEASVSLLKDYVNDKHVDFVDKTTVLCDRWKLLDEVTQLSCLKTLFDGSVSKRGILLNVLWDFIQPVTRDKYVEITFESGASFAVLLSLWGRFQPEQQMRFVKKVWENSNWKDKGDNEINSAIKLFGKFTPEQSKELTEYLMQSEEVSKTIQGILVSSQGPIYINMPIWGKLLKPEQKKSVATQFFHNLCGNGKKIKPPIFSSDFIACLGTEDQQKCFRFVLDADLSLLAKVKRLESYSSLDGTIDIIQNDDVVCKTLLDNFDNVSVKDRLSICGYLVFFPLLRKKVLNSRADSQVTREKYKYLKTAYPIKSLAFLRFFNRVFDASNSTEKCFFVERFWKKLPAGSGVQSYYKKRIVNECELDHIKAYTSILGLNAIDEK